MPFGMKRDCLELAERRPLSLSPEMGLVIASINKTYVTCAQRALEGVFDGIPHNNTAGGLGAGDPCRSALGRDVVGRSVVSQVNYINPRWTWGPLAETP
jgi:hypothetical protein